MTDNRIVDINLALACATGLNREAGGGLHVAENRPLHKDPATYHQVSRTDTQMDAGLLEIVFRCLPNIDAVMQNALANLAVRLGGKLAGRVFRQRPSAEQRCALEKVMVAAMAQLVIEIPQLAQINFESILDRDDVVEELEKAFDANQTLERNKLDAALKESDFDCSTLPRSANQIFDRLAELLREHAERDSIVRSVLTYRTVRQTATTSDIQLLHGEMQETKKNVTRLLCIQEEKEQILIDLEADYAEDIEKARLALRGSRFLQARDMLKEIDSKPGFAHTKAATRAETFRLLGLACMRLYENEDAERWFSKAMALGESNSKLLLDNAELDLRLGRTDKVKRFAESALAKDPDAWYAYRLLAVVALENEDIGLARKNLSRIHESDDPATQSMLAFCDTLEGLFNNALSHVNSALKIAPDDPVLLLQKGSIYLQKAFTSPMFKAEPDVSCSALLREEFQKAQESLEKAVESWDVHGLEEYSAEARIQLAAASANLGDHKRAVSLAEEATRCRNVNPRVWIERAVCELAANNLDAAETSIRRVLDDSPGMPQAVILQALLMRKKGQSDRALKQLEETSVEGWPQAEALESSLLRVELLWVPNQLDKAIEAIDALPQELRDHPRAILARAQYLIDSGKSKEAQSELEHTIRQHPNEVPILNMAALAHFQSSDFKLALQRYSRAMRFAPNSQSLKGVALCCIRLGRAKAALKLLDHFKEKGIWDDEMIEVRAKALFSDGELQEAANSFEEYLRKRPDDAIVLNNAAACYFRLGRRDKAIPLLEKLAQAEPDNWRVCAQLAQIHFTDGRPEDAFRWAKLALDRGTEDPQAHLLYVVIGVHSGHAREAVPVMEQLRNKFPDFKGLRPMPFPEALEQVRRHNETVAEIKENYQSRRLPITFAAQMSGKPLAFYRVLLRRTPLPFLADSGSFEDQRASRQSCSSASEVVIDYPALLTLAQCELFETAKKCFSKLHICADDREKIQADKLSLAERLSYLTKRGQRVIHERLERAGVLDSWKNSRQDLTEWPVESFSQDRFLCDTSEACYLVDWQIISEKAPGDLPQHVITSKSLVNYLWNQGMITRNQYDRALKYLQETHNWNGDDMPLPAHTPKALVVELTTLSTWKEMGLLECFFKSGFDLLVSPLTVYWLQQDILEEEIYQEAFTLVKRIEEALSSKHNEFEISDVGRSLEENGRLWRSCIALAAERQIPLWSDDLVTKAFYAREVPGAQCFGTRTVLDTARDKSLVDPHTCHVIILKLIHLGYQYCWFKSETLTWSLRQHNYQDNPDTGALLKHRGDPDPFEGVIANAIAEMAKLHDESGEPNLDRLGHWMRELGRSTAEGSPGVTVRFVEGTSRLLQSSSWAVRSCWDSIEVRWRSLGFVRRHRGRIQVATPTQIHIWRPDQGTGT